MTATEYVLADGTKLSLRQLTLHADDADALSCLDRYDAYNKVADAREADMAKEENPARLKVLCDCKILALAKRIESFREFAECYLNKTNGSVEDIRAKIVPQLSQDDMETIARIARRGVFFERRILQSLWTLDPVSTFEDKFVLLSQTEAGKTYLQQLFATLSKPAPPESEQSQTQKTDS